MRYLAAMLLLCLPTAAGQVRPLPDAPGSWKLDSPPASDAKWTGHSEAEGRIFLSKIQAIAALLHSAKVFNPPLGFKGEGLIQLTGNMCKPTDPCAHLPLFGRLWIRFSEFADNGDGTPRTDGEVHTDANFYFNPDKGGEGFETNNGHTMGWLPVALGQVGGVTLYYGGATYGAPNAGAVIDLAKRSRPLYIPVSREQFLGDLIHDKEAEQAKQEADFARQAEESKKEPPCDQNYKDWMADREKRLKDNEETYQTLKKADPAGAEQFRTHMEKAEADMPAMFKITIASCEKLRKQVAQRAAEPLAPDPLLKSYRAELAAMTPAERASQAWTQKAYDYPSPFVPANTKDARAVVMFNPDYYDLSRPRTDIQLIEVLLQDVPVNLVEPPLTDWDSLGLLRLWQFVHQVDWQRLQGMISE